MPPDAPGTVATRESIDLGNYSCPRCSLTTAAEFYGPCEACVAELRLKMTGEGGDVEVAEYEPKMNVTPNAVALKE